MVEHMAFASVALLLVLAARPIQQAGPKPIDIGSRRELLVDDYLLASRTGAELRLHPPVPREAVLLHDAPWEGSGCGYHTVMREGGKYRMWYIAANLTNEDGSKLDAHPIFACYAESNDGIRWTKPDLGLVEFQGSKHNNIVWTAPGADNFTPFRDTNPGCHRGEEYKALAAGPGGLHAYVSADGLRWRPLQDAPIITKGAFDTQNTAFWDALTGQYRAYVRDFHNGVRDIRTATSPDFVHWSEPASLRYGDAPDTPLYTNQVQPYYRAPHLYLGFPTRYIERPWSPSYDALPDPAHRRNRMKISPRYGTAITDGLFMSSRDGVEFHRWDEAFIRPGPERKHNWLYGDGYQDWGLVETVADDPLAPPEISVCAGENEWKGPTRLRRFTLRVDGFVSLNAPLKGGEAVTKPVVFAGKALTLNFATSAAGSIRVELQDADGKPLPGHALADCDEVFGDSLDRTVTWKGSPDLGDLAGKPIRVRFVLRDADLYSFRFPAT